MGNMILKWFTSFLLFISFTLPYTLYPIPLLYGNLFQESVTYYEAGDYKKAMMGFMDVVLKEPGNAMAGDYLRRSGAELLKKEESLARQQSQKFFEEAAGVKSKMDDFRKAKAKRLKTWRKLLETAKKFASDHDTIREAVLAYENFLKNTPIYSDGYPEFQDALNELKRVFYKTIKNRYPYLIGSKDTVDERDLATLFFARESIDDFSYRYVYSNQTQAVLDKATKIRMLEEEISRIYSSAQRAYEIYSFGRYQDSVDLWKEVLNFDHTNEEAYIYLNFAKSHVTEVREQRLENREQKAEGRSSVTADIELAPEEKGVVVADIDTVRRTPYQAVGQPSAMRASLPQTERETRSNEVIVTGRKKIVPRKKTPLVQNVAAELALQTPSPLMGEGGGEGGVEEAEKLYEKGVLEFSLGNMENAAMYWEECLKLNPKHLKAKVGLERIRK